MAEKGGRAKQLEDDSPGPWTRWRTRGRADRAIRFIQEFCIAARGYTAGKPLRLGQYQIDWIEESLAPGVRASILSLPRGNGKTTLLGGLAAWATFDPDASGVPEVPVIAPTVHQAVQGVYGAALDMIENHAELRRRTKIYTATSDTHIYVPSSRGKMFPVPDHPPKVLQGLNPTLAVADEIGFLDVAAWNSLRLASGKRPTSLIAGIGTPGFDRNSALWEMRTAALEGRLRPSFRYRAYSAPDGCELDDEEAWHIANPALAEGFLDIEVIRDDVVVPPESHFRIFRLGQWVEGVESWLGAEGGRLWDSLARPKRRFVAGAPTWVGVDVGLKRDSTAVVAVQSFGEEFHAEAKIWIPGDEQPVDITDVMAYVRRLDRDFDVKAVSFDPRFFDYPAKVLGDEGLEMVEIPQSVERMTKVCGRALELVRTEAVTHNGDPLFRQHVLNAVPRLSEHGFTLAKSKSKGRIDGCIGLVLALDRAEQRQEAPRAPLVMSW